MFFKEMISNTIGISPNSDVYIEYRILELVFMNKTFELFDEMPSNKHSNILLHSLNCKNEKKYKLHELMCIFSKKVTKPILVMNNYKIKVHSIRKERNNAIICFKANTKCT